MSEIVQYDPTEAAKSDFVLVKMAGDTSNTGLAETIKQGLGGMELRLFDLPQVTVPSGKSKAWSIPDETKSSGARSLDVLEGVVITSYQTRGYWPGDGKESNHKPPECRSDDAVTGIGTPGGSCEECPLSSWGPKVNGKSAPPPCKQFTHVLLLEKDSLLPINLRIPGTSQSAWRSYSIAAFSKAKRLNSIITSVSLDSHTSNTGEPYQTMKFSASGELDDLETEAMRQYGAMMNKTIEDYRRGSASRTEA